MYNDEYVDNWVDTDDGIDYREVDFSLIAVKNPVVEIKLKKVAARINELGMHVEYQKYLDYCNSGDEPEPVCEPIETYSDFEAWFTKSYVAAAKAYCEEYDVPYKLFSDFKKLYRRLYNFNQAMLTKKSANEHKDYSDPFHPETN